MSWINGPVYKEMRKVWLWLKFPLGIKVVRGGNRGELKDQARDSYSLEGPARQEPTQSLEPPPAHHRAFFFFFLLFHPSLPMGYSEPQKLGIANGSEMCPTSSETSHYSLLLRTAWGDVVWDSGKCTVIHCTKCWPQMVIKGGSWAFETWPVPSEMGFNHKHTADAEDVVHSPKRM